MDEMFARFITETIRGENRVLTVFTVIKNDGEEVLTSEVQAIARRLYAEFHPEGAR